MKNLMKTVVLAVSFIFAGTVFAAGHGHHGAVVKLGEQNSESWVLQANQFGNMNADSKEMVFTIVMSSNGKAKIDSVEALRIWFGDVDSDSVVMKLGGHKTDDGKMVFHSHLAREKGDDHTQFTVEVDTGADEGEILSFKTK